MHSNCILHIYSYKIVVLNETIVRRGQRPQPISVNYTSQTGFALQILLPGSAYLVEVYSFSNKNQSLLPATVNITIQEGKNFIFAIFQQYKQCNFHY